MRAPWLAAAALSPWIALSLFGWTLRSIFPEVLGRYSVALFVFNLLITGSVILLGISLVVRGARRFAPVALVGTYGLSLLLAANNQFIESRVAIPLLLSARVGFVLLLYGCAWHAYRTNAARGVTNAILAAACVAVSMTCVDAVMYVYQNIRGDTRQVFPFRDRLRVEDTASNDVLLVGDSMVWGQGVERDQTFAALMDGYAKQHCQPLRVRNFGVVGAGPAVYLDVLQRVRSSARVIVGYYPNDIVERPSVSTKVAQAAASLGRSSASLQLVRDAAMLLRYPDVDTYTKALFDDYDETDHSFAGRWKQLMDQIDEIATVARNTSRAVPVLIMFPVLWDFQDYPLSRSHRLVSDRASRNGFEVVDLLPFFRQHLGDGRRFLVSDNDNHFDARVHRLIADYLIGRTLAPDSRCRPPDSKRLP